MTSGGVIASCPGQKGHCAVGVTATGATRLNELGRFARSVAIATQHWVITSWRSWGIAILDVLVGRRGPGLAAPVLERRPVQLDISSCRGVPREVGPHSPHLERAPRFRVLERLDRAND